MNIRTSCDLEEAGRLWRELWPVEDIFGFWEARECFQKSFDRQLHMIIAESGGKPAGFLSLSHIEEDGYYGQFPGETWKGRTWFEQNRIPAGSGEIRRMLWEAAPDDTKLRYLVEDSALQLPESSVDETGYIFRPPQYGYDFDMYWNSFSGKSRKKIRREIEALGDLEYSRGGGSPGDIEWMFEMNRRNFGADSYFEDPRFLEGFECLISLLSEKGMLQVTTVSLMGRRAAVDVGAVLGKRYTVLAGATDPEIQGIAKAINLYHIRWGCEARVDQIDFLCGDFGWKERFHLEPRQLFISSKAASGESIGTSGERKAGSDLAC
jgi:hypothetical protein